VLLDLFILEKNLTGLIVDYDYASIKQIDYIEDLLVSLGALLLQHENILIFFGYNVVENEHCNTRKDYVGSSPLNFLDVFFEHKSICYDNDHWARCCDHYVNDTVDLEQKTDY
jgi:hypothetical protein